MAAPRPGDRLATRLFFAQALPDGRHAAAQGRRRRDLLADLAHELRDDVIGEATRAASAAYADQRVALARQPRPATSEPPVTVAVGGPPSR